MVPVVPEKVPKRTAVSSVVIPVREQSRKMPTKPKRSDRSPTRGIKFSQDDVESEITIYKNAVAMAGQSSSSEEVMTSDEGLRIGISDDSNDTDNVQNEVMVSQFVDMQREQDRRRRDGHGKSNNRPREEAQPGTSGYHPNDRRSDPHQFERRMQDFFRPKPSELTPEERAERYICEAKKSKARMFQAPGKEPPYYDQQQILPNLLDPVPVLNSVHQRVSDEPDLHVLRSQLHMAMIDEEYDSVSVHVDQVLKEKIEKGEYVDLARLLPKDRVQAIDDADKQTLQLYHKDGQTFYAPPVSQGVAISSYGKWDKAFRIFSNIYLEKYPNRALELNEYNHT